MSLRLAMVENCQGGCVSVSSKKIGNQFHIALVAGKQSTEYVSVLFFDQSSLAENNR